MIEKLKIKLEKIENELDKCRTSSLVDGLQTQNTLKKSRKQDYYIRLKMKTIQQIHDEINKDTFFFYEQ